MQTVMDCIYFVGKGVRKGLWEMGRMDGRGEDSDLPRRLFVMLCNCLAILML